MQQSSVANTFGIEIIPDNDEQRLEALRGYQILDTPPEEVFTNLAHLVAGCFHTPIALISLVDRDRVFFKGNVGMRGVKNMDRGTSLCSLAVLSSEPTIIETPLEDPCLLANPLVHGKFGLRFYAGAPIITPDGYNIGTVCVVDKKERTFSKKEQDQLVRFARLAMHEIGLRKAALENAALAIDVMTREKGFRTLAHNSPDLIVRHGKDFRYLYISPLIEKLTGRKPEAFIGKSYREMDMPEHLCQLFDESLATVFRTKAPHRVEYSVQGEKEVHIYTRLVPEFGENGEVASVLTISTDITERKNAEAALAYQKKLLETVTRNTTLALFMLNTEGDCVYMNEAAEQMTGYSFSDLEGQHLHEHIHHTRPDGTAYPLAECPLVYALPRNEQVRGEEIFVHKDGYFYNVAFTASPIMVDGMPAGTVLEVKDTTEEKKKEEALRESEHRFQRLANTLPMVVWTASPDGLLTYISDQWEMEYGNSIAESMATGWPKFIHPNDVQLALQTWTQSIKTGKDYEIEFRVYHKNGGYRWHLVRAVPMRNAAGEIISWYGSNIDIEDKKKAEVILEKKVQERTLELEKANQELRRSNQNLEEFAYAASHDMKEPIRKIHFFADRLKERLTGKLEGEDLRYFERLEASTKRMTTLIDDLLVYSHVNRGVSSVETVNLNHVLSCVLDDLELHIEEKGAKMEVGPLPTIVGRPRQLQQLFENLIGNALKYSKEGTVPEIHLTARLVKGIDTGAPAAAINEDRMYHFIQVRDNGIGFRQADAERIFTVFTRLHGNAEGYRGSGIGLSIAQKVVQNHGGYIWAESSLGEGAIFNILLPSE
jgi:PAS domain S-box-containing protein